MPTLDNVAETISSYAVGRKSVAAAFLSRASGVLGVLGIGAALLLPPTGMRQAWGIRIWGLDCTFHEATGLPCPGCGLTRSVTNIFHLNFHLAWAYNPFGYFFATVLVIMAASLFVPSSLRERWRANPPIPDRYVGATFGLLLIAMLLHGAWRMWSVYRLQIGADWWQPPG